MGKERATQASGSGASSAPVTQFIPPSPKPRSSKQRMIKVIVTTTEGRERSIRVVQYLLRLYIYLRTRPRRNVRSSMIDYSPRAARLLFVVSLLSTIRKVLALISHGGVIDTWAQSASLEVPDSPTMAGTSGEAHPRGREPDDEQLARDEALLSPGQFFAERWKPLHLAGNIVSLTQSVADDVECFGRLGVLPESRRRQADRVADAAWLFTSAIELVRVQSERGRIWGWGRRVRRQMVDGSRQAGDGHELTPEDEETEQARVRACRKTLRGLRDRLYVLWWERVKLCADLVFSAYDTFEFRAGSEGVRAFSGAISAVVAFRQYWRETERAVKSRKSS